MRATTLGEGHAMPDPNRPLDSNEGKQGLDFNSFPSWAMVNSNFVYFEEMMKLHFHGNKTPPRKRHLILTKGASNFCHCLWGSFSVPVICWAVIPTAQLSFKKNWKQTRPKKMTQYPRHFTDNPVNPKTTSGRMSKLRTAHESAYLSEHAFPYVKHGSCHQQDKPSEFIHLD